MAPWDVELERKISLTTYLPGKMISGMIKITERAKISTTRRASNSSSLGNMEVLPLELLHAIFAMLDFKTLSDMTRTCSRGLEVVKSLQEYSDLMRHAPLALVALGKTRLIRYHSSATVHAALLSPQCASCQRYGPFLFLPTCQRCCYICLSRNRSLWVIPLSVAKKCFGLSTARVKKLPIMRSLPGKYHVKYGENPRSRQRPMDLVCVGSAKRLALEVEGAEERMQQDVDARYSEGRLSWAQYDRFCFLQRAPLSPLGPSSVFEAKGRLFAADTYPGMASVSFPYLAPDKQAEHGSWCLGCKRTCRQWQENGMQSAIPKHLSHLLVAGRWEDDIMFATEDIAWAEKDFIRHIDECPGAKELIACGTPENFDYQDWSWHTFSIGALADSNSE